MYVFEYLFFGGYHIVRKENCVGSVSVGCEVAHTLFDTGASHSFVSSRLAKSWPFRGVFEPKVKQIRTAGTEKLATTGVH